MRKAVLTLLLFVFVCSSAFGHIGNPNVFFEGVAGPYPVRVTIRPPEVIPGRAQINIRLLTNGVTQVGALPVRWNAGRKGAPPPDIALPVKGDPDLYTTELWIMDFGAYSVFVELDGDKGHGSAIVPLNAVSSQRLNMPVWMTAMFTSLGAILCILLMLIVGAAVRESVVPIRDSPEQKRIRRARLAMAVCVAFLCGLFYIGGKWWNSVDADFKNNRLFRPYEVSTSIRQQKDGNWLALDLSKSPEGFRDLSALVPDHGKLMHLFLIGENQAGAFAHLHPTRITSDSLFETRAPALPAGEYSVYADVTQETGFSQTLISRVNLRDGAAFENKFSDPDDSIWIGGNKLLPKETYEFPNGYHLRWLNSGPLVANQDVVLKFEMLGPDGKPALLDQYMGMLAHLILRKDDGSVFTHLHPAGSISLASQELFARREREQSPQNLKAREIICGRPDRELSFPYAFPKAGKYRLWIQTKSNGEILTGAFDIDVSERKGG